MKRDTPDFTPEGGSKEQPCLYPSDIDTEGRWEWYHREFAHLTPLTVPDNARVLDRGDNEYTRRVNNADRPTALHLIIDGLPAVMPEIAPFLRHQSWVVRLVLTGCFLSVEMGERIVDLLRESPHIQSLQIASCQFGGDPDESDSLANTLANYIRNAQNLRKFTWDKNRVTGQGRDKVAEAIGDNRSIVYLNFRVASHVLRRIIRSTRTVDYVPCVIIVKRNTTLQHVTFRKTIPSVVATELFTGPLHNHPSIRSVCINFYASNLLEDEIIQIVNAITSSFLRRMVWYGTKLTDRTEELVKEGLERRGHIRSPAKTALILLLCEHRFGAKWSVFHMLPLELLHLILRHHFRRMIPPPLDFQCY